MEWDHPEISAAGRQIRPMLAAAVDVNSETGLSAGDRRCLVQLSAFVGSGPSSLRMPRRRALLLPFFGKASRVDSVLIHPCHLASLACIPRWHAVCLPGWRRPDRGARECGVLVPLLS